MPEQNDNRPPDTESRRILERIERETAVHGNAIVGRAKRHFSAQDADAADPIEIWGTRIGRLLGLLVLIAMFIWLIVSISGKG
ncbi:hypothetical protein [Phyllobacterium pellucidum]|uniref:hypothetical protein n=1 Tax=Phyllobacterium pellucidum TaxID=2740464 RepID=UPI001D15E2FE|nr:hypothetical protein [Phyllobacterium sp. T1018]UGY09963.1 hypothetical protein LLE51_001890 [Phyllobacterium sp. T1018]